MQVKFPVNFKDIFSEVLREMRLLSEEIWQRSNAHTAFFLSTAVLPVDRTKMLEDSVLQTFITSLNRLSDNDTYTSEVLGGYVNV